MRYTSFNKAKKLFTFSEEVTGADERRMHGETEEQRHEKITLVATLSLRCVLHISNLVLPNVQRKLCVKLAHERQNTITERSVFPWKFGGILANFVSIGCQKYC